jgi:hypothetical protein
MAASTREDGRFGKFAGPVRRTSTDRNCVVAEAFMTYKGRTYDGSTGKVGCP